MNVISKSQVLRLCRELDANVERFRSRQMERNYSYVWLDAAFVKVRENGRVLSMAVVIAIGWALIQSVQLSPVCRGRSPTSSAWAVPLGSPA